MHHPWSADPKHHIHGGNPCPAPCSPCSGWGCFPASPKTRKPPGKNSCTERKGSIRRAGGADGATASKLRGASSPGRCWWRGFGAAPTPCRGSRVPQDRPEEADEAVSLQQHAQDRPAHEDDEDPPQEEAGALQLLPLEEEGEGPPEADDEDQAGEEEDLGGGKRDG